MSFDSAIYRSHFYQKRAPDAKRVASSHTSLEQGEVSRVEARFGTSNFLLEERDPCVAGRVCKTVIEIRVTYSRGNDTRERTTSNDTLVVRFEAREIVSCVSNDRGERGG